MKSISNAILRMRAFVLVATVALTIIFGYGLTKLTIKSDDIFRRETLSFIEALTDLYTSLEGVASVTSLANIIDIRGTDGGLREYVFDKDIYRGKVVSEDGSASVILSRINPRCNRIEVAKRVRKISQGLYPSSSA